MATKRKPYIRIARSILHEPWSRDVKLTHELLICHMGDRWATDQLTAVEACSAIISKADLYKITGKFRIDSARKVVRKLAESVSIDVRNDGDNTTIYWPKLAEYQGWDARERAEDRDDPGHTSGQSAPSPSPAPNIEKGCTTREREDTPSAAPPASLAHTVSDALVRGEGEDPKPPEWVCIPALEYAIKDLPGTSEAKRAFIKGELGLMGNEVLKDSKLRTNANKAAALRAICFRYYRAQCSGSRPGQQTQTPHGNEGVREREARAVEEFIEANATTGEST